MLERVIFVGVAAVVLVLAYMLLKRSQLRRVVRNGAVDPLLKGTPPGVPTIVYFTTPNCAPCRYRQKPALAELKAELGDGIHIIEVDAAEQPDDAKRWGVFTAPTTFILGSDGVPHTVNHGVADARKLAQQVRATQRSPAAPAADARVA